MARKLAVETRFSAIDKMTRPIKRIQTRTKALGRTFKNATPKSTAFFNKIRTGAKKAKNSLMGMAGGAAAILSVGFALNNVVGNIIKYDKATASLQAITGATDTPK